MLTRLKVNGFKNLVKADLRFGPFTCIAGANGVGKSNLFDAIGFLSALADYTLLDAAMCVRDDGGRTTDVRSLFQRVEDIIGTRMEFEAEMIVPKDGRDDLGQPAHATITFLRYRLELALRDADSHHGPIEVVKEELTHITLGEAAKHLRFGPSEDWRKSAIDGRRTAPFFISTEGDDEARIIKLHQDTRGDKKGRGRAISRLAASLPRTVVSTANAAESPTALMARREMQSWRLLQLEPAAMRSPDPFNASARLGANGAHLAATLYRLAKSNGDSDSSEESTQGDVYTQASNRLAELIDDVRSIEIDRDDKRELLTIQLKGRDGTPHPARSISDGTLRFLALTVLSLDPEAQGMICLEEPENGIHPRRIPAMLRLLQDIAVDIQAPIGPDNPLRQVIVNTHSPVVVAQAPEDSLLFARLQETKVGGRLIPHVQFAPLTNSWRAVAEPNQAEPSASIPKGVVLEYLYSVAFDPTEPPVVAPKGNGIRGRRVIDGPDYQIAFPFSAAEP